MAKTEREGDGEEVARLRARLLTSEAEVPTSALGRMWRTGRSAAGLGAALLRGRRGQELDLGAVEAAVGRLGALKGVAMKVGQMLGHLDPSLPASLRARLSLLQTAAPASTPAAVEAVVRAALGAHADALLAGMERAPVAVASIGQVHRGVLPGVGAVAIKVRHPGVREALTADFKAAGLGRAFAAATGTPAISGVIDEAREAFLGECDFRREAAHQRRFAELFADDPAIVVPEVLLAWSSEQVLVTRWTPGPGLDDHLAGAPVQAVRDRAGAALFRFWMRSLYRDGLFHADPHPGNFAFLADGRVVVYDFGCVREFAGPSRRAFARLAAATRDDDLDAMLAALTALGGRAPADAPGRLHLRMLLRGFFGPLLVAGRRPIAADAGLSARELLADKRAVLNLALPGRLLFLFRLRFGLYAVLARLEAEHDWAADEVAWARAA